MGERTEKLKKYRRLIPQLATLVVIACTLTAGVMILFFNSTLGWFAMNRQVDGNGMGVQVECIDAEAEYTVYLYDAKLNCVRYTGDGYANDPDDAAPSLGDLRMQVHDVIFKSRNRYTPAVIRIHMSRIKEEFQNGGTLTVTLGRDTTKPAYVIPEGKTVKQLTDFSTSILRFTLANNHELDSNYTSWLSTVADPDAAANATYNSIDAALYHNVVELKSYSVSNVNMQSAVFANVIEENNVITDITKADSISLTVNYSASDIVNGEMEIFVYVTYDEELVGHFEHASDIDTSSTTVGKITTLFNDITDLTVSFSAQH